MSYQYLCLIIILISHTIAFAKDDTEWATRCDTQGDKRCYLVQNVFLAENQQRLAGLAFSQQGKDTIALVSVPLGVDLATGVQIQVDDMTPLKVNYQMCNPQGCHGGIAVSRTSLNAMLKAKKLTVFYQEPLGRKIGIPFAVKQFKTSWEKFKVDPQWRTVKSNDSL